MNQAIKKITILSFLILSFNNIFSQESTDKEFIKEVRKADDIYYYEKDYEKAAYLYEPLVNIYPDNSNLAAKLGICYLNIDGRKADAMKLLAKAYTNVVEGEKDYVEYGDKAPIGTHLYYAIACLQNDSIDKALALFYNAKKILSETKDFSEDFIDLQIRNCRYALEMKKKPLTIIDKLFAPWLAEFPGACNPALSRNDSVFIFTVKENGKTTIKCSYKNRTWQYPVDITDQLGGYDRFYSNSITGDGRMLVLFLDDGGDGNLYYSIRKDTVWTRIKSFGKPINTIYWESHGFITPDGNRLFIASNRPGGEGELDIWVSERAEDGSWQQPLNCGNVINTPYDENTPYFDPATGALLFSSIGHISMGGYDIFRSVNRNGGWTNPVGMPYAFNSTIDNTFFILNNNAPGFIASIYNNRTDARYIYSIVAEDPADKITRGRGTVSLGDGLSIDTKQMRIILSDLNKKGDIKTITMTDTSSYLFEIKPGDYQLFVSYPGYKSDTINLNLPLYFLGSYIAVNSSLIPQKVYGGEFLSIKNVLFDFDSYKIDDQAKPILERVKNILISYPDLKMEIAGYTDAMGSTEYNRKLADKRATAVINYFLSEGLSDSRFIKKAYGESNFVALNTGYNGSDNPEGRKYNRRVTFGIIDPQTGIILSQETYTPEHLRQPSAIKYGIVLVKTLNNLAPGYFNSLKLNELNFIQKIVIDTASLYVVGLFNNKSDASTYLEYVRSKGFKDAYIVTHYEINSKARSILDSDPLTRQMSPTYFIIQLKATKQKVDIEEVFRGIKGVKEVPGNDGFYRYIYGEYSTYEKAKAAIVPFLKSDFQDAFVRDVRMLPVR